MNRPARLISATVLLAIGAGCAPAPIYKPIAVIDPNARQLRLMALNSTGDKVPSAIAGQVDPASMRRDELQGASLWLTINGADGKPTAAASWKKSQ